MDTINFRKYVPERYDCDNFAFSLMGKASYLLSGYALGVIFVKKSKTLYHAMNFYVDDNKQVWLIEPQTDIVYPADTYQAYYAII